MNGLVVTKLDVMDELQVVRICVGYTVDGKPQETVPIGAEGLEKVEAVYEEMPGWQTSTVGMTRFEELPEKARRYLRRLEETTGAEVAIVSTGPDREHTIIRHNPFD
jgi:adenylosuccinate synthase